MASGFLRLATIGTTQVRVHWVAPVVWALGGFSSSTGDLGLKGILAAVVVYGVHAMGHWLMANFYRLPVSRLDIDGFGASVAWTGRATRGVHAAVAFGGVIAHLAFAVVLLVFAGKGSLLVQQMIWVNFVVGCINVLPFGRLDGADGWRHLAVVLRQPMPTARPDREHPTRRARRLIAEADREIGHSAVHRPSTPSGPDGGPEPDWNGDAPEVREIASQFESLMTEVRADVQQRRRHSSDDEPV
ncbi:MAG TPA: hypothetical protein DFR83_23680 [Deltaproteobacteria bacterium]|nr:hypothetical protein [Deltaproteobacteria bacterium]